MRADRHRKHATQQHHGRHRTKSSLPSERPKGSPGSALRFRPHLVGSQSVQSQRFRSPRSIVPFHGTQPKQQCPRMVRLWTVTRQIIKSTPHNQRFLQIDRARKIGHFPSSRIRSRPAHFIEIQLLSLSQYEAEESSPESFGIKYIFWHLPALVRVHKRVLQMVFSVGRVSAPRSLLQGGVILVHEIVKLTGSPAFVHAQIALRICYYFIIVTSWTMQTLAKHNNRMENARPRPGASSHGPSQIRTGQRHYSCRARFKWTNPDCREILSGLRNEVTA
jgi:hypothetical protein